MCFGRAAVLRSKGRDFPKKVGYRYRYRYAVKRPRGKPGPHTRPTGAHEHTASHRRTRPVVTPILHPSNHICRRPDPRPLDRKSSQTRCPPSPTCQSTTRATAITETPTPFTPSAFEFNDGDRRQAHAMLTPSKLASTATDGHARSPALTLRLSSMTASLIKSSRGRDPHRSFTTSAEMLSREPRATACSTSVSAICLGGRFMCWRTSL